MKFGNLFKNNSLLAAAVTALCCVCISQAVLAAGPIVGWGKDDYGQATPPDGNDFVAITAGELHSLVLRTCPYNLIDNLNDDCKVDFRDLALMASSWLVDCSADPGNPACVPR